MGMKMPSSGQVVAALSKRPIHDGDETTVNDVYYNGRGSTNLAYSTDPVPIVVDKHYSDIKLGNLNQEDVDLSADAPMHLSTSLHGLATTYRYDSGYGGAECDDNPLGATRKVTRSVTRPGHPPQSNRAWQGSGGQLSGSNISADSREDCGSSEGVGTFTTTSASRATLDESALSSPHDVCEEDVDEVEQRPTVQGIGSEGNLQQISPEADVPQQGTSEGMNCFGGLPLSLSHPTGILLPPPPSVPRRQKSRGLRSPSTRRRENRTMSSIPTREEILSTNCIHHDPHSTDHIVVQSPSDSAHTSQSSSFSYRHAPPTRKHSFNHVEGSSILGVSRNSHRCPAAGGGREYISSHLDTVISTGSLSNCPSPPPSMTNSFEPSHLVGMTQEILTTTTQESRPHSPVVELRCKSRSTETPCRPSRGASGLYFDSLHCTTTDDVITKPVGIPAACHTMDTVVTLTSTVGSRREPGSYATCTVQNSWNHFTLPEEIASVDTDLSQRSGGVGRLLDCLRPMAHLFHKSKKHKQKKEDKLHFTRQQSKSSVSQSSVMPSPQGVTNELVSTESLPRSMKFSLLDCSLPSGRAPSSTNPHDATQLAHKDLGWEIPFHWVTDLHFIGSGTQGSVFRGCLNGEYVALKKVREKKDTEIGHLRHLNHENVIRFKGVCVESVYGIIMDYCEHGQLFDLLRDWAEQEEGGGVAPWQLSCWSEQIARGMHYLHSQRIIHRDLKSPNVLVASDYTLKISDFGVARNWTEESTRMTFAGTVAWMAPEIIRMERCSYKVDIWSFGVLMWELLTSEIPYRNLDTSAIIWGVGSSCLNLPLPETFPCEMRNLMRKCWESNPKNRPDFANIVDMLKLCSAELREISPEALTQQRKTWKSELSQYFQTARSERGQLPKVEAELIRRRKEELQHAQEIRRHYEEKLEKFNRLYVDLTDVMRDVDRRRKQLEGREAHLNKVIQHLNEVFQSCDMPNMNSGSLQSGSSSSGPFSLSLLPHLPTVFARATEHIKFGDSSSVAPAPCSSVAGGSGVPCSLPTTAPSASSTSSLSQVSTAVTAPSLTHFSDVQSHYTSKEYLVTPSHERTHPYHSMAVMTPSTASVQASPEHKDTTLKKLTQKSWFPGKKIRPPKYPSMDNLPLKYLSKALSQSKHKADSLRQQAMQEYSGPLSQRVHRNISQPPAPHPLQTAPNMGCGAPSSSTSSFSQQQQAKPLSRHKTMPASSEKPANLLAHLQRNESELARLPPPPPSQKSPRAQHQRSIEKLHLFGRSAGLQDFSFTSLPPPVVLPPKAVVEEEDENHGPTTRASTDTTPSVNTLRHVSIATSASPLASPVENLPHVFEDPLPASPPPPVTSSSHIRPCSMGYDNCSDVMEQVPPDVEDADRLPRVVPRRNPSGTAHLSGRHEVRSGAPISHSNSTVSSSGSQHMLGCPSSKTNSLNSEYLQKISESTENLASDLAAQMWASLSEEESRILQIKNQFRVQEENAQQQMWNGDAELGGVLDTVSPTAVHLFKQLVESTAGHHQHHQHQHSRSSDVVTTGVMRPLPPTPNIVGQVGEASKESNVQTQDAVLLRPPHRKWTLDSVSPVLVNPIPMPRTVPLCPNEEITGDMTSSSISTDENRVVSSMF